MIFDFSIQILFSIIFLLGLAGVGLSLLRIFYFRGGNIFFDFGVAYFISLCLYIIGAVSVLLMFPWKILSLQVFTVLYIFVSYLFLFRIFREKRFEIIPVVYRNKEFLVVGFLTVIFFFFQIYHTSILDEWLHRPVVKSFTENGVFPLINPLSPEQDFIHSYHYGTQIVSSAIQVLTRVGVSESMDVFKLGYFMAAFVLFYGILWKWIEKKREAALGAFLTLYAGSSFFLLDAFSVSHIWRLKWIESEWPLSVPPAYTLSGITWVNIVLSAAFILLLEHILKNWRKINILWLIVLGCLFSGFFLISEIFALLILVVFLVFLVWKILRESKKKLLSLLLVSFFSLVIFLGVYATGGIVRSFMNDLATFTKDTISKSSENNLVNHSSILSFRTPSQWGYPAEKKILNVSNYPMFYLRNFLLEIILFIFVTYAIYKKKENIATHPILISVVAVGFLLPFFFSTSYGTLNLTKLTAFSLIVLHLVGFALFFRLSVKRGALFIIIVLFIFSALPGVLIGSNIQWRWISDKGKEQYCSQNPLCYKGEFTELLKKFDQECPGFKRIVSDSKNARKINDLTGSYVYSYKNGAIDSLLSQFGTIYIVRTPELDEILSLSDKEKIDHANKIFERGESSILLLKGV